VFLSHGGLGRLVPGGLGVTIFFVLSGYLITTLMRREHARSGTLDLGAFYLRRWLRLMPPLFVVVAGVALCSVLGLVHGEFSGWGLLAVLFYFGNYFVIANDFAGLPAGMGVVWSLAVEEHYYVVFPLLALVLLRLPRPARAAAVLGALCVAMLGWRVALFLAGTPEPYLGMATDTRADAILMGCLLAFLRNPALEPIAPGAAPRDLLIALSCLGVLLATLAIRDEAFRQTLRYTLQGAAIAPLIWLAVVYARRPAGRWLNLAPLAYLGTISYTVYLVHHVILDAVAWHWPALGAAPTLLLGVLLTLAVAEPVRRFVERPCAKLRRRLHERAAHASARRRSRT
jgi:peptidoglycan/LPS O-acetylase OafA/YrhL